MAATFAGVALAQPLPETVAWVERNISTAEVFEFQRPVDAGLAPFLSPDAALDRLPLKTNSLFWPRSASRWAYGHFFCTENQLGKIRAQTSVTTDPLPLTLTDPANSVTITTNLSMLPARPLAQFTGANGLYLLTLVDDRYFWWNRAAQINVSPGNTQWADLYYEIARGLEINPILFDPIDAAYLTPPISLASAYGFLPLLLDAVAYSIGQRITRQLNGTVYAKNYAGAKADVEGNLATLAQGAPRIQAGGTMALDDTVKPNDLNALVPANVTMIFQEAVSGSIVDGQGYAVNVPLTDLAIPDYGDATGYPGNHVVHNDAVAIVPSLGASAANQLTLDTLTAAFARDWYLWQLGFVDTKWAGLVSWTPDGLHDHVEWVMRYPGDKSGSMAEVSTRVQRPPWNEIIEAVFHHTVSINNPMPPPPSSVVVQHDTQCINGILNVWMKVLTERNGIITAGAPYLAHTAGCCQCTSTSVSSASSSVSLASATCPEACLSALFVWNNTGTTNSLIYVYIDGVLIGSAEETDDTCMATMFSRGTLFLPVEARFASPPAIFDGSGNPVQPLHYKYHSLLDRLQCGTHTIKLVATDSTECPPSEGVIQLWDICLSKIPGTVSPGQVVMTSELYTTTYVLNQLATLSFNFNVTNVNCCGSSTSSTNQQWYCFLDTSGQGFYGGQPTCDQKNEANGGVNITSGPWPDLTTCLNHCGAWFCVQLKTPTGCDGSSGNPCDISCEFLTRDDYDFLIANGFTILSGPYTAPDFCTTACTRLWYCVTQSPGDTTVCLAFTAAELAAYQTAHPGDNINPPTTGYATMADCLAGCGNCLTACDIRDMSPTPQYHFTLAGVVNGTCTNCDQLNGTWVLTPDSATCILNSDLTDTPICDGSNPGQWILFQTGNGNTWALQISTAFNDDVQYLSDGSCWDAKTPLTLTRDFGVAFPGTSCSNWPETITILPG